jgi:enamine deaminase RidA (YjgF/YER057c/UK114 family)
MTLHSTSIDDIESPDLLARRHAVIPARQLQLALDRRRGSEEMSAAAQPSAAYREAEKMVPQKILLADMGQKAEMNRAWDEWASPENPPVRTCVGVVLEPGCLVEMVVTATTDGD